MSSATDQVTTQNPGMTTVDYLRYAVIFAMFAASIYFVGSLAAAITSDSLASPLNLGLSNDAISSPYPDSASIAEATAAVDVKTSIGYRLAWWSVTDALALGGIGFLELLRRILAKGTDPFTSENASRLRWMVVLAMGLASVSLLQPIVSIAIQDNAGFDGFEATWDLRGLAVALVLAALLEIWRHGVALRADADLTI